MKTPLDIFKSRTIVNCNREPYLKRWYVFRTNPFAIFIHRFFRSDEDRALHDHPWSFITFIIWRGYNEYQADGVHRRWPLTVHYRPATHRHRVELIDGKPCWTIVFRFREHRMWGFWEKSGFIPWNKWWQNNCE